MWEHMAGCDVDQEELLIFAAGLEQCPLLLLLTLSTENSSVDLELFVVEHQ